MGKEEIFQSAYDAIVEVDEDKAWKAIDAAKEQGIDLMELLAKGFSAGMRELGDQFGRGEVFLPELIFASDIMKKAQAEAEIGLEAKDIQKKGVMVIGTVAGDVHDIGKGIVCALVKSSGFEVHDVGREVPAQVFVDKAKEYNADFIGSSTLLTTTMTEQKNIEEILAKEGIRDKYKTLVGGAPVTKRWAEKIGADAYCEDAQDAIMYLTQWSK